MKDTKATRQSTSPNKDVGTSVTSGDETFPQANSSQQPKQASPNKTTLSTRSARIASRFSRPAGWAVTLIIGSLLVPAITKQWSDRPRELEIKTSMVRDMSELATDTISSQLSLISGATVKARLYTLAWEDYQSARGPEKQLAKKQSDAARKAAVEEAQEIYSKKLSNLLNKGAAIKAQLQAYFPETRLAGEWSAYNTAIVNYLNLNTIICGEDRSKAVAELQGYLTKYSRRSINWASLSGSPYSPACHVDPEAFNSTYRATAEILLSGQDYFLKSILKADMAGFSSGWGDFFHDTI